MIGTRLGPYEITAKLGEGGMGEVWRATDTRLDRAVAIKLLPAAFTQDPERLARFEREAKLLAQLHHPHIASIFGLEESDGVRALVMELVEGPTLQEKLGNGGLPLEEVVAIARQIAEALEAAHEKGIVHRDLKPANVKLTADGNVKVLDFGLAKALDPGASSSPAASPTLMRSPTLTAVHGTQLGVILGTAAYMAPEQARGAAVDKRADIWAFGVVLYEMLTGRMAFAAPTVPDTLAAVLRAEIDWNALPTKTPTPIRRLLRRCLERNPKARLHDIADARIELDEPLSDRSEERPPEVAPARGRWKSVLLGASAALALGLAVGHFATRELRTALAGGETTFERLTFRPGHFVNARFAPDGQTVFLAADWQRNDREIFQVRPSAGELPIGITGADLLSVSRSGELAVLLPRVETGNPYNVSGTLAVVSASGGTPRSLADGVLGADWAPDGRSLAALRIVDGKWRIEYPLGTLLYESPTRIYWLRVSPSGDAVAFFERTDEGFLVVVVERSGERRVWSNGWSDWWNLAWSPDGEEIWFGASRTGAAAALFAVNRRGGLRTLLNAPGTLELHDVAADGSLLAAQVDPRHRAFGARPADAPVLELSWLEESVVVDLSADGKDVLLEVTSEREPGGAAVFLRSMDGAPPIRLGEGRPQELSRDGRWALALRRDAIVALSTGAGREKVIEAKAETVSEAHWMPDGIHILAVTAEPGQGSRATVLSFDGDAPRIVAEGLNVRPALQFGGFLFSPVSPDGRSVAVAMANEQVVVLPLDGGPQRPVPGSGPNDVPIEWTPDGRSLYLLDPSALPTRVSRVDLASGRRELWRDLLPLDRAGVAGVQRVSVNPDATALAYSYQSFRSNLYRVRGLR